jgi:predicted RNA-binding Zn-ribbon protein involved in translation (DUF1610 family)
MSEASINEVRKDDRQQFQPVAQRYRRHCRMSIALIFTSILSAWVASAYDYERSPWFVAFFLLSALVFIVATFLAPALRCPTCGANAGGELERYCPECGGSPLDESWLFARRCSSCNKQLVRGKSRHYRVRFCTNCGAFLDEDGV